MKRFVVAAALLIVLMVVNHLVAQSPVTIAVVRDPGCGCCLGWVTHVERAGFKVTVTESADRVAKTSNIPGSLRSCHTGTVGGYMIEGHVPAVDIKRLLIERPNVVGLAVPGMPMGSPGMESPTGRVAPYSVLAFDKTGKVTVFAQHR
jgi:hypothetical protein